MSEEIAVIAEQLDWWKSEGSTPAECLAALGYKIRLRGDSSYVVEWGRRLPISWATVDRALRSAVLAMIEHREAA